MWASGQLCFRDATKEICYYEVQLCGFWVRGTNYNDGVEIVLTLHENLTMANAIASRQNCRTIMMEDS